VLDQIRKGQRWLTAIFVGAIGIVFVFFLGLGGPLEQNQPSGNAVVELGEIRLDVADFQRTRAQQEARLREAMGDQFDLKTARDFLDSQTLSAMIESAILANAASDLGLEVSSQEIKDFITSEPSLRDASGRFDREAFESWVQWNFGSERAFVNTMRLDLLRGKMLRLLLSQAQVSDSEARAAALYGLEQLSIAYVKFDTTQLPSEDALPDEEVQAYLSTHEAELRARYEEQIASFEEPEQVRVRQIFFELDQDASEEAAAAVRKRAEQARKRIEAGEAFAAVAEELSEDPGSKDQGGDLGLMIRGQNIPELEEAAFSLEEGSVSDPVRSFKGLHLLLVEERVEAQTKSFEVVGPELARTAAEDAAATTRAEARSEELASAIRGGKSLEDAARELELNIERTGFFTRRPDGFVPGLGGSEDLMSTAFALSLSAPSSPKIFEVGNQLVIIQLLDRLEPDASELEDRMAGERDRMRDQERSRILRDWIENRRSELLEANLLLVNSNLVMRQG
jgi:peptidyl-prolyl cis-trans isomerase D